MEDIQKNNKERIKKHLVCNEEVYNLITKDCVIEYLKHHPEMEGANISQNHILKQIASHYIVAP